MSPVATKTPVRPRFPPGARVRVRSWDPPGHVRTPFYTRGHVGEIVQVIGPMPDPEEMAYGRTDRPPVVVYRVRFSRRELWPEDADPHPDTVVVDLCEHWLEPAEEGAR